MNGGGGHASRSGVALLYIDAIDGCQFFANTLF
jgi:hypothetical protein